MTIKVKDMGRFNKATASAVAGAIGTIIAAFFDVPPQFLAAGQGVVATLLVYAVANTG